MYKMNIYIAYKDNQVWGTFLSEERATQFIVYAGADRVEGPFLVQDAWRTEEKVAKECKQLNTLVTELRSKCTAQLEEIRGLKSLIESLNKQCASLCVELHAEHE